MDPALIQLMGLLISALCLFFAFRARKRQRLISDLPTSKTSGVFMGMNELKGKTRDASPVTSYLAEAACVYYRYSVSEKWSRWETERYTDSKGKRRTRRVHKSGWRTVAQDEVLNSFEVEDNYGQIRIRPEGANIEPKPIFSKTVRRTNPLYYGKGPSTSVRDSDHIRRFNEYAILLHDEVYILGHARERDDIVAAEIASSKFAPYFLISTRNEKQIVSGKSKMFWGLSILGAIPPCATLAILADSQGATLHPTLFTLPLILYLAVWLIGWSILIYNSLVGLYQRLRQAESLVEIQLKRRSDLIPRLVEVIQGLKEHSETLLADLAQLRHQQQQGLDSPDEALFAPSMPAIMLIKEDYPELNTEENFLHLQQQLIDTEDRIELARRHYNEVASFWNMRQEILPDRFLAPLLGKKEATLFEAAAQEKKPIEVTL